MKKILTIFSVLLARVFVIGIFTFIYSFPLFLLFYLIIFRNTELLSEISLKFYLISFFIVFILFYNYITKVEKENKK